MMTKQSFLGGALALLVAASAAATDKEYRELAWEDLLPEGTPQFVPDHSAPMDQVQPLFGDKPLPPSGIVTELNDQAVRIPGFIVPLDVNGDDIRTFLLVPYFGACIHLPPPPPNQIVYVTFDDPIQVESIWEPVWVNGTMITQGHRSNVGEAGYTLQGASLEKYEW